MHEPAPGFFHLDYPADGAALPAGRVVLRGWAVAHQGVPFVDLRLRVADAIHPAVHGFPRADLPAVFGLNAPFLLGGFEAGFFLRPGEQTIRFEALDISGSWQPVGSVRLHGEGAAAPAPPAPPALQPHEFARALQFTLRGANTRPVAEAAQELIRLLPVPAITRYPHAPFHGHLHEPTQLERVLFGRLRINGWLFHETAAVRRVVATVDLQTWQDLTPGGAVPYVAAAWPQFPAAVDCAVQAWIDVPAQLPSPLCVRVYAELADGSWHLCQVQRTHVSDLEQEKVGFAPVGRVGFVQAALALRRAALARGFVVPWSRLLLRAVTGVYHEYLARRRPRPAPAAAANAGTGGTPAPLGHVTLVTHNLNLEGAPLFLSELGRHLAANGTRLKVIAALDGPLAAVYAAAGAEIQLVQIDGLAAARSGAALSAAIDRLAAQAPLGDTDLVIANTLSGYWGVHLARRSGRPSLFYIHESTTPVNFYLGQMAPATLPLVESTFRLASHVSFLTESTRVYYQPWLGGAHHSINPGWIDVPAIDSYIAAHSRASLRQALGLKHDTRLVVNLGTVCDRKGQHIFARAVDLFWRREPALAATCEFLMVGAHDTLFDQSLRALLRQLNRPNLKMMPATATPLAYYGAADLAVCSSYEESFPRVILEAMACRVPILSTAVHGIRDMLTSGEDSLLVPAGDSHAMALGIAQLLSHPDQARAFADRARARVVRHYSTQNLLPRHAALAGRVAHTTA